MLLALAAALLAPQPGALKTFGDWVVGCDNARACSAVALVPMAEDRDRYLMLAVAREGARQDRPVLLLPADPKDGPYELRVDGRLVARVTGERLPFNRALASTLANGRQVSLTAKGKAVASASLAGLAAAFLYIDEQQHRLGTVGALRRTGPKLDSAVPSPPPLPRIVSPRSSPRPPRQLAAAAAARLIGPDAARCDDAQGPVKPRAFRLDAAHSLSLVEHPCGNGAYNFYTSVFILDESGRATPARFDAPASMGDGGPGNLVVNGDWDPGTRRLTGATTSRRCGSTRTGRNWRSRGSARPCR